MILLRNFCLSRRLLLLFRGEVIGERIGSLFAASEETIPDLSDSRDFRQIHLIFVQPKLEFTRKSFLFFRWWLQIKSDPILAFRFSVGFVAAAKIPFENTVWR